MVPLAMPAADAERARFPTSAAIGHFVAGPYAFTQATQEGDVRRLRRDFSLYLRSKTDFQGGISVYPDSRAAVLLDVDVRVELSKSRTWIFDVVQVATLGVWPFAPLWGEAQVRCEVVARSPDGVELARVDATTDEPFSVFLYSRYRNDAVDAAFETALSRAFESVASQIASARGDILQRLPPTPRERQSLVVLIAGAPPPTAYRENGQAYYGRPAVPDLVQDAIGDFFIASGRYRVLATDHDNDVFGGEPSDACHELQCLQDSLEGIQASRVLLVEANRYVHYVPCRMELAARLVVPGDPAKVTAHHVGVVDCGYEGAEGLLAEFLRGATQEAALEVETEAEGEVE
jgi:hypothetical protein